MNFSLLLLLILSFRVQANELPHMDLEMTGFEYEQMMKQEEFLIEPLVGKHMFDDIFKTGKRNLDWNRLLNQHRNAPISFSSPETQLGFPIHKPRIYNPRIIRDNYTNLRLTMPDNLGKILFGVEPLPAELPCSIEEYIKWGLEVDRVYQIAVRWKNFEPHMAYLTAKADDDIRGYHFITSTPGLLSKIKDWSRLSEQERTETRQWLIQVCRNNLEDALRCSGLVGEAINSNQAFVFFSEHKNGSEKILQEMMTIPNGAKFPATEWTSPNIIEVPFIDPKDQLMRSYLVENLQGEWRLFPFSLQVLFVPEHTFGVQVIWSPGITPHVPGLGADKIFMDSNAPLNQYDVQWTIRHEFGHVLGFPDCYIEFYDNELKAIVSYQIDTGDLMCSRRGHIKGRHVDEMERVYR
jgi:hypothetical protein